MGLDVTFYYTAGRIETTFVPGRHHAGYREVVHGGILATLLDECMGWSAILSQTVLCVTADISIRYKSSAKVGEPLRVYGELATDKKRIILARGGIEKEDGAVVCSGEGKYVPLSPEEQQAVIDYAGWGEEFARVCSRIQQMRKRR